MSGPQCLALMSLSAVGLARGHWNQLIHRRLGGYSWLVDAMLVTQWLRLAVSIYLNNH